jgi:hypothetical protein
LQAVKHDVTWKLQRLEGLCNSCFSPLLNQLSLDTCIKATGVRRLSLLPGRRDRCRAAAPTAANAAPGLASGTSHQPCHPNLQQRGVFSTCNAAAAPELHLVMCDGQTQWGAVNPNAANIDHALLHCGRARMAMALQARWQARRPVALRHSARCRMKPPSSVSVNLC